MSFQRLKLFRYPLLALAVILTLLAIHQQTRMQTASQPAERTITITISSAGFLPNRLKVAADEMVTLRIVNTDVKPHNLSIPALHLASGELAPSQSSLLQFIPRTKGQFTFVSDVPGYPETGYQGVLIIE